MAVGAEYVFESNTYCTNISFDPRSFHSHSNNGTFPLPYNFTISFNALCNSVTYSIRRKTARIL